MIAIVYPQDGWILQRMAEELLTRVPEAHGLRHDTPSLWETGGVLDTGPQHINYFINYALMRRPTGKFDAAWFTHPEADGLFYKIAQSVDLAICNCDQYRDQLRSMNVCAETILPGVGKQFVPRLRLGFMGRFANYAWRKGADILEKVSRLPFVDLYVSGGNLSAEDLPGFYNSIDYVLVTSRYEGGPMCLLEGIACGKKVICPLDVGAAQQFREHVIAYENGSWESLEALLRKLQQKRLDVAEAVASCTWSNWALQHLRFFRQYATKSRE